MARGDSGRIVIKVSPDLKRQLYSILAIENLTLKDWFIEAAKEYVAGQKRVDNPKSDGTPQPMKKKL